MAEILHTRDFANDLIRRLCCKKGCGECGNTVSMKLLHDMIKQGVNSLGYGTRELWKRGSRGQYRYWSLPVLVKRDMELPHANVFKVVEERDQRLWTIHSFLNKNYMWYGGSRALLGWFRQADSCMQGPVIPPNGVVPG